MKNKDFLKQYEAVLKQYRYSIDTLPQEEKEKEKEPKEEPKEKKNKKDIDAFFESVWKLYPEKTGKGKVSDAKKAKLYKYGYDVMALCIDRYKKYVAQRRATDFKGMLYQSGATFFNSGYVDYLDANYNQHEEEWRDTSFDQFYEN